MAVRDVNFFYPGEEILADEMRITALGTGMPFCRRRQASPGWLVELGNGDKFIFDLGTGSSANLNALGIPHSLLDKVFLTHLHIDHFSDIGALYGMGMVRGRFTPLRVWGPSAAEARLGTAAFGKAFTDMMAWDIESRRGVVSAGTGWQTDFTEFDYSINGHVIFEENGVTIRAFPAIHCIDGPVSYRLDWNGLSMAFLGDGKPSQFMVDNAQNVDVLIHEAFVPAADYAQKTHLPLQIAQNIAHGVHCPPRSAGKIFDLCQPRLGVIYHTMISESLRIPIIDDLRVTWKGPATLAEDLMVLNVTKEKITQRQACVPDLAWPVPAHNHGEKRPAMETQKVAQMSQWLKDAEIKVDGVSTFIADAV